MGGKSARKRAKKALAKALKQEHEAARLALATATATHGVLNIIEILEAILLALPTKDLLLAQRVSRQWKAVIDSSIHIQRALFLLPKPVVSGPVLPGRDIRINPLFAIPASRRSSALPIYSDGNQPNDIWGGYICQTTDEPYATRNADGVVRIVGIEAFLDIRKLRIPQEGSELMKTVYPSGAWRRMYVSQPPCTISWMINGKPNTMAMHTGCVKVGEVWARWRYFECERISLLELVEAMRAAEIARREEAEELERARENCDIRRAHGLIDCSSQWKTDLRSVDEQDRQGRQESP